MAITGGALVLVLVAAGALGAILLVAATWGAFRSRRPAAHKPPRKTFEHGRRLGRARRPLTTAEALQALRASPVGEVTSASAADGRVDVVVERRRSQPCTQAAGFVAGVFESAWAHEVLVTHPQCAGEGAGTCHYVVQRAPTGSGAPGEGASTRGSAGDPRRSPRARAGRG